MRRSAVEFTFKTILRLEQDRQNLKNLSIHDLIVTYGETRHVFPFEEMDSIESLAASILKKVGIEAKEVRVASLLKGLRFLDYDQL